MTQCATTTINGIRAVRTAVSRDNFRPALLRTRARARGDPSRDRPREGKREKTRAGKSITIVENICRGPERGGPGEGALERERKGTHAFRGAHDDDEETVGGRRGRIRGRAVYAEESRDAAARLIGFSGSHDAPCRRSARRQAGGKLGTHYSKYRRMEGIVE